MLPVPRIARIPAIAQVALGWLLVGSAASFALGTETCVDSPTQVCAAGGRYRLSATYSIPGAPGPPGAPIAASGRLLPAGAPAQYSAVFWFSDAGTIDLRVGVVERCASPPSPGVDISVAATTQNAFTVRVEDLETSTQRTLTRKAAAVRGTLRAAAAFPCTESAN